jgi:hypothetical protein
MRIKKIKPYKMVLFFKNSRCFSEKYGKENYD